MKIQIADGKNLAAKIGKMERRDYKQQEWIIAKDQKKWVRCAPAELKICVLAGWESGATCPRGIEGLSGSGAGKRCDAPLRN